MTATFTIDADEGEALHGLLLRRLTLLPECEGIFAQRGGFTITDLYLALGDELRLFDEVGLDFKLTRRAVELEMPREKLVAVLKRLRRDARCAPCEARHEREPEETGEERWQRFRRGVEVCEELLCRLDSLTSEVEDSEPIRTVSPEQAKTHELTPYIPVADVFVLAAAERAVRHEQEEEVLTSVLTEHLGFEGGPSTNKHLWPRLEELRQAGLLTSIERRGEPLWSLTSVGRERLDKERKASDLPESPQHRAWRHAREQAAVRIEGFKAELTEAVEEADDLINQYRPVMAQEWFALHERLRWASWRFASATYCLTEWPEPDDEFPDVDENPGPRPGRRSTWAWDRSDAELGGAA